MLDRDGGMGAGRLVHGGRRTLKFGSERLWRGLNAPDRRAYLRRPPQLEPAAAAVLAGLDRDGVAVTTLAGLTGDDTVLTRLQSFAAALEEAQAEELHRRRRMLDGDLPVTVDKPFVLELLDRRRPVVAPDGLLARIALHPQLRGVADCYFGLRTRVADLNVWRSLTTPSAPSSSQLWHRDVREDHFVLKAFVYLEDVDEGGGPFTYLRRSHPKGPHRSLRLPAVAREAVPRASEDAPAQVGLADDVVTLTGPAGTLIFADTLGYHRGGFARTRDRLLLQVLYASRAADRHRMLGTPAGVSPRLHARDLAYDRS